MPTGTLPASGKKLWEQVYNDSLKGSCKGDKQCAAQSAWAAVKGAGWKKIDGKWTKKSDLIQEFSMHITKASLSNGVMAWAATNSDTDPDSYDERMSLELYENFIYNIKSENPVPEEFKSAVCSNYWCGGMPYLSVSHYPDLNGDAVPGEPLELFVDGKKLKAKGILFDSPLGHSVYRALKEDKYKSTEEKIRISIGFLDLAHKHGENGKVFVRDSLYSLCPECLNGIGQKIYVDGYLVHLALTRVPVNKRTEMVLEEKAEMTRKKTRKEDAASIVGKDLAEEIEMKQKATAQRSDVLIEMSETEEETQELIAEVEANVDESPEVEPAEPQDKEPEPEGGDVQEEVVLEPDVEEKSEDEPMNLPYGGATSMRDAEDHMKAKEEMIHLMDMWSMFSNVAWNIFERPDIENKKAAFEKALDEFKSMLSAKAMLEFSDAVSEAPEHDLKPVLDELVSIVDNCVVLESDSERAEQINPALQGLGKAIADYLAKKSVSADEPPAPENKNDELIEQMKSLIQPLVNDVKQMSDKIGILEAKSNAQAVEVKPRIPQPRTATIPPSLVAKSEPKTKPGSLRDIINKSVGITE